MAFAEDFTQCIAQYGVTVAPQDLPEQDLLNESLTYLESWLESLDASVREGFDEASANEPISVVLADSEVNAAPSIALLLEAFDLAQGLTLSYLLQAARYCAQNPVAAQ